MPFESLYKPEYCALVLDYGKEGLSRAQMARNIGVSRKTLNNWSKQHPDFDAALDQSLDYAQAWWEDQVQKGVWAGSKFNALAWHKSMVARFRADYTDTTKIIDFSAKPSDIPEEQATTRAAALLSQAARRKSDIDDDAGGLA